MVLEYRIASPFVYTFSIFYRLRKAAHYGRLLAGAQPFLSPMSNRFFSFSNAFFSMRET